MKDTGLFGHWVSDLGRDLRYAVRLLGRQPGFAVTAVLTLALGLGSATALFAWVDRMFLQPLPIRDASRVFNLGERFQSGQVRMAFSYPEYLDYQRFDRVFAGLVAFDPNVPVELDAGAGPERARAALVSANFFSVLGVSPMLGRAFDADAETRAGASANAGDAPGAHPVAVLSYAAWQRLYSGNPEVVGRTLRLNGHVFTIIGVAPRDFSGLMRGVFPALFVPVGMLGQVRPSWTARPLTDRNHVWLAITARLPMAMGAEQAGEAATASARALDGTTRVLTLMPGSRGRSESVRAFASSAMLFSAAAVVLLMIVCANVSGLFLARVAGRQRELATRLALGASRSHLIRHSLVEALLTAVLGGACGLIWASGLAHVLGRMSPMATSPASVSALGRSADRPSHVHLRVGVDADRDGDRRPGARAARRARRRARVIAES